MADMDINVTLMNKERPVMRIAGRNITRGGCPVPIFQASSAEFIDRGFAPPAVAGGREGKDTVELLNEWLRLRSYSDKRRDIPEGKRIRWKGRFPMYFSLTDQYWLRYRDGDTWAGLNFFTNRYDAGFGDTVFSKALGDIDALELPYQSPDVTTNGVLRKRWIQDGEASWLVKHKNRDFPEQNPVNEILASRLLKRLNIVSFVEYALWIEGYDLCCRCRNFVDKDTEFVPAFALYFSVEGDGAGRTKGERIYNHLLASMEHYGIKDGKEFIDSMIIADRLLLNRDRHLGNFGFLRDANTAEYVGFAPLFDFGDAFFSQETKPRDDLFAQREKYLFDNGRIPVQDMSMITQELDDSILYSEETKRRIRDSVARNRDYIIRQNKALRKARGFQKRMEQQVEIIM